VIVNSELFVESIHALSGGKSLIVESIVELRNSNKKARKCQGFVEVFGDRSCKHLEFVEENAPTGHTVVVTIK